MSSQPPRSRNSKRARVDEETTKEENQDVRLCAVLRRLLGGRKYVKQSELSREVLLSYAIQKGAITDTSASTATPAASSATSSTKQKNTKRARMNHETTFQLCAALRGLLGGNKYVKQSDLSCEVLLSYAIQQGDVVPVTLFTVTVEPLAGDIFDVKNGGEAKQRQAASAPHSAGARHASFLVRTLFIAEEW